MIHFLYRNQIATLRGTIEHLQVLLKDAPSVKATLDTKAIALPTSITPTSSKSPHIQCVSVRGPVDLLIQRSAGDDLLVTEASQSTGTKGVVAAFRNTDVDETGISKAHNLKARLFFFDSRGVEIGTGIDDACWLDTWETSMSIDVEATKHVVILAKDMDAPFVLWHRNSRWGESHLQCIAKVYVDQKLSGSLRQPS